MGHFGFSYVGLVCLLALFAERPGALTVLGGAVIICGIALYSRTEETA